MTISINEMLDSRTFATSGDEFTASRSFICYDDGDDTNAEIVEVMVDSDMVRRGETHPDAPHLFASTYTASHSDEGVGVWEVKWDYKTIVVGEEENPLQPDQEPKRFTGLTVESNFNVVDIYKDTFDLTAVNIDSPGLTDDIVGVGGVAALVVAKAGGNPISLALPTASITITEKIQADPFQVGQYLGNSGKRNLNPWLGLDAGSVVYKGVSINRTGPARYQLTYNFFWDKWYHMRQIPKIDPTSKEIVYDGTTNPPTMEVYWRQPFKETMDFGFQPDV